MAIDRLHAFIRSQPGEEIKPGVFRAEPHELSEIPGTRYRLVSITGGQLPEGFRPGAFVETNLSEDGYQTLGHYGQMLMGARLLREIAGSGVTGALFSVAGVIQNGAIFLEIIPPGVQAREVASQDKAPTNPPRAEVSNTPVKPQGWVERLRRSLRPR